MLVSTLYRFCILTILIAAHSGRVSAQETTPTTLHVPEEFPTIQAAVDAATPGDTVQVAPGIYREHVSIGADKAGLRMGHRLRM